MKEMGTTGLISKEETTKMLLSDESVTRLYDE